MYRVSLAEKIVIPARSHVVPPGKAPAGILPAGSWMVENLHKSPGVLTGRNLVGEGRGKVSIEMLIPSEGDVKLNRNTYSALLHSVEEEKKRISGEYKTRKVTKRKPLAEELQRVCEETRFDMVALPVATQA